MDARPVRPQEQPVFGDADGGYAYVNHFEVGFSRDEVLLRLAQAYEGVEAQSDQARIVMTPAYAKALLQLLAGAVTRFEDEYGEVQAAGAGIAAPGDAAD